MIFTVMDGARVYEKLAGGEFKLEEGGVVKYYIRAEYPAGAPLAPFAQRISVKLPFAQDLYEEPLCNVGEVLRVAEQCGFALVESRPFSDLFGEFGTRRGGDDNDDDETDDALLEFMADMAIVGGADKKHQAAELSDVDRQYVALHQFVVLKKVQ
jgi:hypothetical protein